LLRSHAVLSAIERSKVKKYLKSAFPKATGTEVGVGKICSGAVHLIFECRLALK